MSTKLTPHQRLGAAVLDVLVGVHPGTFKRNSRAREQGRGAPSTQVSPWALLKLRALLEEQFPGAEARTRAAMRCEGCGTESYQPHRQSCPTLAKREKHAD